MKIGVTIHATDLAMSPVELAREAEPLRPLPSRSRFG
jgi:hypothetical protein